VRHLLPATLRIAVLLACLFAPAAADSATSNYLIVANQTGLIEFLDPASLKTLSSISVNLPLESTGLRGIFADPNGHTVYIEGPVGPNSEAANNCCWLYSIDLSTLQTTRVAGIWGTSSRHNLVNAGPGMLQLTTRWPKNNNSAVDDRWQVSPDGRWWFGLRDGPALDLYDVANAKIARSFAAPSNSGQPAWATGAWLGNQFYVYAKVEDSARLWTLSPDSSELGDGVVIPDLNQSPVCSFEDIAQLIAASHRLLLYEVFGGKVDRRFRCPSVPGGVSVLDPATGNLTATLASERHFWTLVPNADGSEFFAITSEEESMQTSANLLRISAKTGQILQQRTLGSGYSWLANASLQSVPPGHVTVTLPTGL